ncbi:protease modulator HflK [Sphingobium sufflavum]|uniref:protease modulator HflK n=1 Tax=Sphingobium sufflavum TaxID=1129547 RepID=UPI001F18AA2F|nr:protease modulator HflK [Sphingobium sufflavum]
MNENSPWGGSGGSDGGSGGNGRGGSGGGPRNPWSRPPGEEPPGGGGGGGDPRGPSAVEELMRRARSSFGDGLPGGPDKRALWFYLALGLVAIWLATTCIHRIGPQERGIVTFFGSFSRTLTPGIGITLPEPLESVKVIDVEEIRTIDIGSTGESGKLVLTGDQNIINLAYSVRWNISRPELYVFQIADTDQTIGEVAESAMRAVLATVTLNDAMGAGRTTIEEQVRGRMQEILDGYRAGVRVQGVAIKQADPPEAVNDAFKEVSAAQQTAQTYLNQARAYAQQLTARAQGEAAAFDKVYGQYKLAPEVTRRRMYYETMEQVLAGVDKTIVEANGVTPYLPLSEVARRAPAQPRPEAEAAQ